MKNNTQTKASTMPNSSPEMALLDQEEREMLEYIWNLIPEEDKVGLQPDDVLFALDAMADYLEDQGLVEYDEQTGEATYSDGDIDETEQLEYVKQAVAQDKRSISNVQIQLIIDAEFQYGVEQGYYEEED